MTKDEIEANYDTHAPDYDDEYSADEYSVENHDIADTIERTTGVVEPILDLGAGTGLFLELFQDVDPKGYLGVDLSQGMVNMAEGKFPGYDFLHADIEDWVYSANGTRFNTVVAMFGIWSYLESPVVTSTRVRDLMHPGGRIFVMAYRVEEDRPNARAADRRLYQPQTLGTILSGGGFVDVGWDSYATASIAWGRKRAE